MARSSDPKKTSGGSGAAIKGVEPAAVSWGAAEGAAGGGPVNKLIPPQESPYTEFTRDRAEKLATLRRGMFDEFTWSAIVGLTASLPSTTHSIIELHSKPEFSLSAPEATDFGVTLVFLTLCGVAIFSKRNRGINSMEYFEKHFGKDPDVDTNKGLGRFFLFLKQKNASE